MKVYFFLKYHTHWGEKIFVTFRSGDKNASLPAGKMQFHNAEEWRLEVILPDSTESITYHYTVEDRSGARTQEESVFFHQVTFDRHCGTYFLYDDWLSKQADKPYYTSAITKNLFARPGCEMAGLQVRQDGQNDTHFQDSLIFRVRAPAITPDRIVALTGNQTCLGNWEPRCALLLSANNYPLWEIRINADDLVFPLEYKFLVLDRSTLRVCYWEEGTNRVIDIPAQLRTTNEKLQCASNACIRVDNAQFRLSSEAELSTLTSLKTCGTVIPVFSLRSEQSFGIGDLGDLKKLIDWAKITNQHVIQVLPMNDTTCTHTWKDSYPYSAISIYALHPLYISIPMLGALKDKKKAASYRIIQKRLNKKESVDYPSVEKYKTAYYRNYFEQERDNILQNKEFQEFISQNKEWLIPYAAFSYLRDKYQTADHTQWEDDSHYNAEKWLRHCNSFNPSPAGKGAASPEATGWDTCFPYQFFIQFTLHLQMEAVARYARENRIILKGDLPIGVNRESVEVWTEPAYFNTQVQAGAPPDSFSEKGQNWFFPTYNWNVMREDGFAWWKKRFLNLQQYFDCFRIDHILGFFRIWEIPAGYTEGLCGYFNPALPLHKNEIEQYGIRFDEQWLTPRVHIIYIPELFGDLTVDALSPYLRFCDAEHLALNDNCATQQKINQLFHDKKDERSQLIKDGLMHIANEVLFIRDPYQREGYHPRILANQSYRYRALPDEGRRTFDKLYHHFFFERHNEFWKQTALNRLQPLLKSTQMLVCGEDLGMIPATVHEVMESLQIGSLELERMSKTADSEFTDLTKLPYFSVCTTSTHDMNPIRAWWTENRGKTQRYYNKMLQQAGIAPEACPAAIAEQIIRNHLNASSMITVIPLQDWLAMDDNLQRPDIDAERINIPANANHYWRYRMHVTIETLLQSTTFNDKIRRLSSSRTGGMTSCQTIIS